MTIFKTFHEVVGRAVEEAVAAGDFSLHGEMPSFIVEPPRDPAHGDLAVNVAMTLTKCVGLPPKVLAKESEAPDWQPIPQS